MELDALNGDLGPNREINGKNYCAECEGLKPLSNVECPLFLDDVINQTLTTTFYNLLTGKMMLDVCHFEDSHSTTLEKLNFDLAKILQHDFSVSKNALMACFLKNNINFKKIEIKKEGVQKVLTAYLHILHRNILDSQKENLKKMGSIDQLLGRPPLDQFVCDEKFKETCQQVKNCHAKDTLNEMADFSLKGIKEISLLENQWRELTVLKLKGQVTSEEHKVGQLDIRSKIQMLKDMMPWFKGDELSTKFNSILEKVRNKKDDLAREQFVTQLKTQLSNTHKNLKEKYFEENVGLDCLENNQSCKKDILSKMNSWIVKDYSQKKIDSEKYDGTNQESKMAFKKATDSNLFLKSGYCVGELLEAKKDIDSTGVDVAATVTGLVAGGAGGVLKLGQIALTFFKAGNRLKGLGSFALLGAEGTSVSHSFSKVSSDCQRALKNLEEANHSGVDSCSKEGASIFKVTQLNSCIANIAMTTLPYVFSLRSTKKLISKTSEVNTVKLVASQKETFLKSIKNQNISSDETQEIAESISKIPLNSNETLDVINDINTVIKSDADKAVVQRYIHFVESLKVDEQKEAILKLSKIFSSVGPKNEKGHVQSFLEKEKMFSFFQSFRTKSIKKKLIKSGIDEERATEQAAEQALLSRNKLQKRFYECQSKIPNPTSIQAAKRYTALTMVLGIGGTMSGYYNNNKELLKDQKVNFFGNLSYDIVVSYLLSKLNAKITKSPDGSFGKRFIEGNISGAKIGLLDSTIYSQMFSVSEEEARIKIEEILHSPESMKEFKILDAYIEKEGLVDKFKNHIVDSYKKVLNSKEYKENNEILVSTKEHSEDDLFSHLKKEDLDRPENRDRLVNAIMEKMNSGSADAFLSTGDKGVDRWISDRAYYGTVGTSKNILMGLGLFQILCLGGESPVLSFGVATGLQFPHQMLSGEIYYKFRKWFIGQ
jgi:hypothetical protein